MANFRCKTKNGGEAWRFQQSIPPHCPPLVRQLIEHMNATGQTIDDVCAKAGINRKSLQEWKHRGSPRLGNFEALCNAAGLDLVLRRAS